MMETLEFRFAFFARDFAASVDFYQNTLGMTSVGGWDRPDGKGALLSTGGTAVIEIYGAAEGKTYNGPSPEAINLAIRLANTYAVDSFYEQLKSAGARLEHPPEDRPWGHRSFVVYDPDNIPIHYYCEIEPISKHRQEID
jgi:catechol 2,3-dioxygenase-like lactoylglutathione lyase family enzyme